MALSQILNSKCFGGYQKLCILKSKELSCETKFAIYLPPNAEKKKVPLLYWLDDKASDPNTFITQAGAQRFAAEHGIGIVCPDTSPRKVNIPQLNSDENVGAGASFYVDAKKAPWCKHFKMYSYITSELLDVINNNFPVIPYKQSIAGFSMGGHGAILYALKNPNLYCSVSALEPDAHPINSEISQKAYQAYFGDVSKGHWHVWDATEVLTTYSSRPIEIFIDQGSEDNLFQYDLHLAEFLYEAAKKSDLIKCLVKWRRGYNHDHFYVSSVIGDHIEYHSRFLKR